MANKAAVDVTVKQLVSGSQCQTGFTFLSDLEAGITPAQLVELAGDLVSTFMPVLNALQGDNVINQALHLQARGYGVPSYETGLTGGGTRVVAAVNQLPPEFCYWVRWYCDDTVNAIGGDPNTAHPIRRGGAFISGVDDEVLENGAFVPDLVLTGAFNDLVDYMIDGVVTSDNSYKGAVLGEGLGTGGAWRVATIIGGVMPRVTMLRKRRV